MEATAKRGQIIGMWSGATPLQDLLGSGNLPVLAGISGMVGMPLLNSYLPPLTVPQIPGILYGNLETGVWRLWKDTIAKLCSTEASNRDLRRIIAAGSQSGNEARILRSTPVNDPIFFSDH